MGLPRQDECARAVTLDKILLIRIIAHLGVYLGSVGSSFGKLPKGVLQAAIGKGRWALVRWLLDPTRFPNLL